MSVHKTKEWKEKADEFKKGKVCEWCGTDELLHVHHQNGQFTTSSFIMQQIYLFFREEYSKAYTEIITIPNPKGLHLHKGIKQFHPITQKHKNPHDHKNTHIKTISCRKAKKGAPEFKEAYEQWRNDNKIEIQRRLDEAHEIYLSLEGCIVLCKRCHFAAGRGKNLCPVCKQKYKSTRYETCFKCIPKDRLKKISKWNEAMNEIADEDMECDAWFEEIESASPERRKEMQEIENKKWRRI